MFPDRTTKLSKSPSAIRQTGVRANHYRPELECLEDRTAPAVITVTGTGDTIAIDGVVTLREAITAANTNRASGDAPAGASSGQDAIFFNIEGTGPFVITPNSALPTITEPLFIDGFTQIGSSPNSNPITAGTNAVWQIILDGSFPGSANGLTVQVSSPTVFTTIRGLVIRDFPVSGIALISANNLIEGNLIGAPSASSTDANGRGILVGAESSGNTIGGQSPDRRNLISGNATIGVFLEGSNNLVAGNLIGTDVTGTAGVPVSGGVGIHVTGTQNQIGSDQDPDLRNVISGNSLYQIQIDAPLSGQGSNNLIAGNYIGLDVRGVPSLGSSTASIRITGGSSNGIVKNLLSGKSTSTGVLINSGVSNLISENSIFDHGGLPIDLSADATGPGGTTPNDDGDGDSGPNQFQNAPVLTSVSTNGFNVTLAGSISSRPLARYVLEFFWTLELDPSGLNEGQKFIGNTALTTGANGTATFQVSFQVGVSPARLVAATATDPDGNTSEFSASVRASPAAEGDVYGDFIRALYRDILGRNGSESEISFYRDMLNRNPSAFSRLSRAFWVSSEHRGLQVDFYYREFLGRLPDPSGRAFHINRFRNGATEDQVIRGFLASAEYRRLHPDNNSYINGLYADLLHRTPTAQERNFWVEQLNTLTRDQVAVIFLRSDERFVVVTDCLFLEYLDRSLPPEHAPYFLGMNDLRFTLAQMAQSYLGSDEYFSLAVQRVPGLSGPCF